MPWPLVWYGYTMTDIYSIPAHLPVTVHTLRQLHQTFRRRNQPPPYRVALLAPQWRGLERDILRLDRHHWLEFRGGAGSGFPTFSIEGIEVSRLTEVDQEEDPRWASLLTTAARPAYPAYYDEWRRVARDLAEQTDRGWRTQFGTDILRGRLDGVWLDERRPVSTHSSWPD